MVVDSRREVDIGLFFNGNSSRFKQFFQLVYPMLYLYLGWMKKMVSHRYADVRVVVLDLTLVFLTFTSVNRLTWDNLSSDINISHPISSHQGSAVGLWRISAKQW